MFKYTAHPNILHKYASIRKNSSRPWDDQFHFAVSIMGSTRAYFACGDFWKHYKGMAFYSQEPRKEIPVNGILIPAMYFLETEI